MQKWLPSKPTCLPWKHSSLVDAFVAQRTGVEDFRTPAKNFRLPFCTISPACHFSFCRLRFALALSRPPFHVNMHSFLWVRLLFIQWCKSLPNKQGNRIRIEPARRRLAPQWPPNKHLGKLLSWCISIYNRAKVSDSKRVSSCLTWKAYQYYPRLPCKAVGTLRPIGDDPDDQY